jgi:phytoene dehydrogenase-like protein
VLFEQEEIMHKNGNTHSVIIIGAGIAGLSAGIYAQLNGFQSRIYEMHSLPGGVMTSWKRKGYLIDGCVQWLMGSSPKSNFYPLYEEVGLIQNRQFFHPDVFLYFEDSDGQALTFYANIERLEKELVDHGPEDRALIHEFCSAARALVGFNPPVSGSGNLLQSIVGTWSMLPRMICLGPTMLKWTGMSMSQFADRFKTPFLRQIFSHLWQPEMTVISLLFFLAYISHQMNGFPIGGSLAMALAVEKRYRELGGEVNYGCRVEKILVENHKAVGVRLANGVEQRADIVISAADGHATIWCMLDGRYLNDAIRKVYAEFKLFPPIMQIGLGVKRTFNELPCATGGMVIELKQPFEVANKPVESLKMTIYNFDPTLAPTGKTLLNVKVQTDYDYWKELLTDRERYDAEKQRIALEVINRLDQRFPGLASQVEMADVATPMTYERYTGNWQASYEGFLPTPKTVKSTIPNRLPGLKNFYMAGQWVRVGGGIPTGVSMGREAVKCICKEDGIRFQGN